MANDNQIKQQKLEASKSAFLPAILNNPERETHIYSLEDEYAKTKKNKHPFIYLSLLIFIGLLGMGSFILIEYDKRKSSQTISIQEFADINLVDLLDTAGKYDRELDTEHKKLADLRVQFNDALQLADTATEKDSVKKKFNPRIEEQLRKVAILQEKVDSYNKKLRESANKMDVALGNQKKLYELKLDEQRDYYERKISDLILKYNPLFDNKDLNDILKFNQIQKISTQLTLNQYNQLYMKEKIIDQTSFTSLRNKQIAEDALLKRMLQIPYVNSVNPSLKVITLFSRDISNSYELMCQSMLHNIDIKNQKITAYQNALNYLLKTKPENGYIIDAGNPANIDMHLTEGINGSDNHFGYIFRNDDEYIAKIGFYIAADGSGLKGKLIELQPGKTILPFDKIMIKTK